MQKYNADINHFGGMQDYHMIHESLRSFFNGEDDLKERFVRDNIFGIRTEEGRGRFYRAIKSSILTFSNENHQDLYKSFFQKLDSKYPYNLLVFWQMAINNKLFYNITNDLYLKYYFDGKLNITGDEVFFYMNHLKEIDEEFKNQNWTKKTSQPVASKYLTVLKKLELVEGSQKKQLKYITTNNSEFAIFLYILMAIYGSGVNIIDLDIVKFSFVSRNSLLDRVKVLASKNILNMSFTGDKLRIEPLHEFIGIANVLY